VNNLVGEVEDHNQIVQEVKPLKKSKIVEEHQSTIRRGRPKKLVEEPPRIEIKKSDKNSLI
jgi:hypothetical protein